MSDDSEVLDGSGAAALPAVAWQMDRYGSESWYCRTKPQAATYVPVGWTVTPLCDHATATAALKEAEQENQRLRTAIADGLSAETLLTGMTIGNDGITFGLQGGAAALLVEMLAKQYADSGAINYLQLTFESREILPGESFTVMVQRLAGKTPHQLRVEAEVRIEALEAQRDQALVKVLEVADLLRVLWAGSDPGQWKDEFGAAIDAALAKTAKDGAA